MTKWKHVASTTLINRHRSGWLGVWDALVAAVKGDERISVRRPMTLEMWVGTESDITAVEMRGGEEPINYLNGVVISAGGNVTIGEVNA